MADILEVGLATYVWQLNSESDPRVAHLAIQPSSLQDVLLTAALLTEQHSAITI
jgi:hypothetical protein